MKMLCAIAVLCTVVIGFADMPPSINWSARSILYLCALGLCFVFVVGRNPIDFGGNHKILIIASATLFLWILVRAQNFYGYFLALQLGTLLLPALMWSSRNAPRLPVPATFMFIVAVVASAAEFFYPGTFANRNYLAVIVSIFCLPLLHRFVLKRSVWVLVLVPLYFSLLMFTGSRAVIVAVVFGTIITLGVLRPYTMLSFRMLLFFMLLSSVIFLGAVYYHAYSEGFYINDLSLQYTGKRLTTGRIDIWGALLADIKNWEILIGSGGGVIFRGQLYENMSVHSLYLYIYLAYGIVGLMLFALVIYNAVRVLMSKPESTLALLLVMMLLFRDLFELSLITNVYPVALFFWCYGLTGSFSGKDRTRASKISKRRIKRGRRRIHSSG